MKITGIGTSLRWRCNASICLSADSYKYIGTENETALESLYNFTDFLKSYIMLNNRALPSI